MKTIIPSMYQLEKGIRLNGKQYIGSIHTVCGDNMEISLLGTLTSMFLFLCQF